MEPDTCQLVRPGGWLIALCAAVSGLGSAAVGGLGGVALHQGPEETEEQQGRIKMLVILSAFALAWPLVWWYAVGMRVHSGRKLELVGLVWPLWMLSRDIQRIGDGGITAARNNVVGTVQEDTNSLIGVCFAFGTLSIGGGMTGSPELTLQLILAALVVCIAFVVPSPIHRTGTTKELVSTITQRCVFQYASGLVISGLVMNI